ncbi:MAG: hypothetical protein ACE5E9_11325 [Nitrospinaceae bacterium]
MADETQNLDPQIEELRKRIEKLESQTTGKQARREPGKTSSRGSTTASGISRKFNPAISVNGLLLGTFVNEGRDDPARKVKTGLKIQEVELQLAAVVDTYLKGQLTLSLEEVDKIEIEEFIADILVINNLALRAGKFFAPFGKHNLLHTHQFPFIDAPLINAEILGKDGLNEIGGGLSALLPTTWFSEFNFQFLQGDNPLFKGPLSDDFLYLAHLKNLLDLTDELTLELGGSFAYGRNDNITGPYNATQLSGADLTFKWKPAGRERYRTLVWQSEFLNSSREVDKKGIYTFFQYQFARRWWVQARYDFFTIPRDRKAKGEKALDKHRYSALLAFVLSEFSALRLQYNYLDQFQEASEHQVLLQLNFTFGSHPAHSY